MKLIAVTFVAFTLAGCSSVVMNGPFPDSELTPKEQESLAGSWHSENQMMYLNFTSNAIPCLTSVEWKDDRFSLIDHDLHIAKRNEVLYASMAMDPDNEPGQYLFAEIRLRDRELLIWGPDIDAFKKMVKEGKLEGTVNEDNNVVSIAISSAPVKVLETLSTTPSAIDYRSPLLFRKMP